MGGGRRRGGKWDSQGGGKRVKEGKLHKTEQYFTTEKAQRGGKQKKQGGNRE